MNIDIFKTGDGYYEDDSGTQYNDAEEFLTSGILDFCGCGNPVAAADYVRESLQLVHDRKELVWNNKMTFEEWDEKVIELFHTSGAEYFMWYYLDNMGFAEHGGSVPGWLTQEGEELLSDLTELINNN